MKGRKMNMDSPKKGVAPSDKAPAENSECASLNVMKAAKAKKHGGKAMGEKSMARADRTPRKAGGRTGSNMNPFSSAHKGTAPKGRAGLEMN
jgi:hypothetical protein